MLASKCIGLCCHAFVRYLNLWKKKLPYGEMIFSLLSLNFTWAIKYWVLKICTFVFFTYSWSQLLKLPASNWIWQFSSILSRKSIIPGDTIQPVEFNALVCWWGKKQPTEEPWRAYQREVFILCLAANSCIRTFKWSLCSAQVPEPLIKSTLLHFNIQTKVQSHSLSSPLSEGCSASLHAHVLSVI